MMEERKVPALRFQGFADEWEERKLGEIADSFEYGLNAPATEYDGKNKYIRITDIDDKTHHFLLKNLSSPNVDVNFAKNYRLKEGDILFARTGASVGKSYIYRQSDGLVYYAGFLIRAHVKKNYDSDFVYQNTLTSNYSKYISITSQRSGQPGVNAQEYSEYRFMVPSLLEQKKISRLIMELDQLIFNSLNKLTKLQSFKKSMLEKMFPRPGKKVPEVQFRGFTGDWEKRKLGSIFEEYSEKNHAELPPLMIVQGGGTILRDESDRSLQYDRSNLSSYKMVNKDDFIVHLRSFEGGLEKASSQGIISPAYHTFHGEGIDARFYYAYFRSAVFIRHDLKPHVYGIRDGRSIDIEGMKSILIPYTSYEEQKKIGDCISLLDQLIMLCQRKLEKLQSLKQAMLSEMFI